MNANPLIDKAFSDLIGDLREHFISKESQTSSATAQSELFANGMSQLLGQSRRSGRAIRDILKNIQYNPDAFLNEELLISWSIVRKFINKEDATRYFKIPKRKRSKKELLEQFLQRYESLQRESFDPEVVKIDGENQPAPDKLLVHYTPPYFGYEDPRQTAVEQLLDEAGIVNKALFLLESIPFMGKSIFLSTFAMKAIKAGMYKGVVWKALSKGDSLRSLLAELDPELTKIGLPLLTQANMFLYALHDKEYLLILDGFENANQSSFTDFFRSAALYPDKKRRLIIATNDNRQLRFLPASQTMALQPYSVEEFSGFLHATNTELPLDWKWPVYQKTEGLPYYVELVCKIVKNNTYQMDLEEVIANLPGLPDFQCWVDRLLTQVHEDDAKLLHALSVLDEDFTDATVAHYAQALNITDSDFLLKKLKGSGLVKEKSIGRFETLIVVRKHYQYQKFNPENKYYHTMAADYICPFKELADKKSLTNKELSNAGKAVRHLQLAGNKLSQQYLKKVIPFLKRRAFFEQLEHLLRFEFEHQLDYDRWLDYHYAHWGLVTGQIEKGLDRMVVAVENALQVSFTQPVEADTDFFVKVFQLCADYFYRTVSTNAAVETLTAALNAFAPEHLAWDARTQAMSALSWYFIRSGDLAGGEDINTNILQDCLSGSLLTQAVSLTRLGVIQLIKSEFSSARETLEKAMPIFEQCADKRGLAWCQLYITHCQFRLNESTELHLFKNILLTNKDSNLYDPDYLEWLTIFNNQISDDQVATLVKEELKRVKRIARILADGVLSTRILSLLGKLLPDLKAKNSHSFDYRQYIYLFDLRPVKIDSIGANSYIQKIIKTPVIFFNELFARKKATKIFNYHLYNRALADSLNEPKFTSMIFKRFIRPNFKLISDNSDSIRLHYAHALQETGYIMDSMTLLDLVQPANQRLKYFITRGGCFYGLGDFNRSFYCYQRGLKAKPNSNEQAKIYNSLARMIHDLRVKSRYQTAKGYCNQTLKLTHDENLKCYAYATLFRLTEKTSASGSLTDNLQAIIDVNNMNSKTLDQVIESLPAGRLRDTFCRRLVSSTQRNR